MPGNYVVRSDSLCDRDRDSTLKNRTLKYPVMQSRVTNKMLHSDQSELGLQCALGHCAAPDKKRCNQDGHLTKNPVYARPDLHLSSIGQARNMQAKEWVVIFS